MVDMTDSGSTASLIERRNFGHIRTTPLVAPEIRIATTKKTTQNELAVRAAAEEEAEYPTAGMHPDRFRRVLATAADENANPALGVLSAQGFVPASELAARQAGLGTTVKDNARPPKRRKTGESRALRDVSDCGNGRLESDGEDESQPKNHSRPASRRRRTTEGSAGKLRRTKSARLPLERVPAGQGMHTVVLNLVPSMIVISQLAQRIEQETPSLQVTQPAVDTFNAIAGTPDQDELRIITAKLRELLVHRVSDGEMVQDLGELVRQAFATRGRGIAVDEGASTA